MYVIQKYITPLNKMAYWGCKFPPIMVTKIDQAIHFKSEKKALKFLEEKGLALDKYKIIHKLEQREKMKENEGV